MHISYKPLWHTLLERDMRKGDLRLAAGTACGSATAFSLGLATKEKIDELMKEI